MAFGPRRTTPGPLAVDFSSDFSSTACLLVMCSSTAMNLSCSLRGSLSRTCWKG